MKKRVSLARAIALDPQVILYDEPTAGLDPLRCMDINRLVVNMQKQLHATSVIVTHDMDSAFFVADRLAYLQDGRFRLIADKKKVSPKPMTRTFSALSTAVVFRKKEGIVYEMECRGQGRFRYHRRCSLVQRRHHKFGPY